EMASLGSSLNSSATTLPSADETRSLAGGKSTRWPLMIMKALGSVVGCVEGAAAAGRRACTGMAASAFRGGAPSETGRDAAVPFDDVVDRLSQPTSTTSSRIERESCVKQLMMHTTDPSLRRAASLSYGDGPCRPRCSGRK